MSITHGQSSLFDDPELRPPELNKRPGTSPASPTTTPAAVPANTPPSAPVAPATPVKPATPGTPTAPGTTPAPVPVQPATKPAPPVKPPEPDVQQMFASLYGVDARRVEGTPSTKDDLEFARKLLGAVPAASESRPLQRVMLERAYLYATKDTGGTADEASIIRTLRQLFPGESLLWDERWLLLQDKMWRSASAAERLMGGDIYRRLLQQSAERLTAAGKYADAQTQLRRAGDIARGDTDAQAEIKEMLRYVADRQRLDRRGTELLDKAIKLQGATDAATLTEAVELLGAVLPRQADIKKLPAGDDKVLAYLVAMLQVPDNRLTTAQAAWLGDYFRKAAERPQLAYRVPLLRAAATWYSHFLSRHLPLDAERLRVLLSAQQVAASLAEAAPTRTYAFEIGGTAASLIKLIEPARHRISGDWQVTGATAAADAGSGPAQMVLPLAPGDAYEITLQYSSEGASAVGLHLPIGSTNVALSREADETSISTSSSSSRELSDGFPSVSRDTERHTLYARVVVKGRKAAIIVAVDGYEAGKWEGWIKDLAAPADLELPDRSAIGVFVRGGKARVTDLSVHSLKSPPRLVQIAMPDELPLDGSRPRDAVVSRRADNSVTYTHHGVTLSIDPTLPGGASLVMSEPVDDVRMVRNGFTSMMSSTTNLTPLRMEYRRYKELLAMSTNVPKQFDPSDLPKLKQFSHDYDLATSPDAKQRAEQGLFAAMHVLGDRYQKSITSWAKSVQKTLTPEEAKHMMTFATR